MRWRWIGLAGLAAGIGLWLWLRVPSAPEREQDRTPAEAAVETHAATPLAEGAAAQLVRTDALVPQAPAVEASDPSPTTTERPNLALRAPLAFLVVDTRGDPIAGAEISLTGTRTPRARGSHFGWRIEEQLGRTDGAGRLVLMYPKWTTLDDDTGWVTYRVAHPRYVTHEADARVAAGEERVVLQLGSVLVVSGWVGKPEAVVTDVRVHLPWNVDIQREDWLPRRDGRLTTTRVPPGRHVLRIEHESAEHGRRWSAPVEFEMSANSELELHLELVAPLRFRGRFGDEVPRPVLEGRIAIAVHRRAANGQAGLFLRRDAAVAADGSFEIGELPPGDAQYVAMCRGWTTPQVETLVGAGTEHEYRAHALPTVELGDPQREFVVTLEPAAKLELALQRPDGTPLAEATVHCWPNACWTVGLCQTYFESRDWRAVSDAQGRVVIEDLPAGGLNFGVEHGEFQLPLEPPGDPAGDRYRRVELSSGQVARMELKSEPLKP